MTICRYAYRYGSSSINLALDLVCFVCIRGIDTVVNCDFTAYVDYIGYDRETALAASAYAVCRIHQTVLNFILPDLEVALAQICITIHSVKYKLFLAIKIFASCKHCLADRRSRKNFTEI